MSPKIAVLLPCRNEEKTIRAVVEDFRRVLPEARVYVFDNCSTDNTKEEALAAGAEVYFEPHVGKGAVVRSMFREVDADVYLMVDGDGTYPAGRAKELIQPVLEGRVDMVVGTRLQQHAAGSFPRMHQFGNHLVRDILNILFRANLVDVLSGYRCFSKRFVKTMPVLSRGFEIETEMTLYALDQGFLIQEIEIPYGERPAGSVSKLHTVRDGFRVLKTLLWVFKDYRPLLFFGGLGLFSILGGLGFGSFVLHEFTTTGRMTHPSTALLSAALGTIGFLLITTGLILDTVNRRSRELHLLLVDHVIRFPH